MAVLLLFTLGAESVYAIQNDGNNIVEVSVEHNDDAEQGKTIINILKDQHDAIPHSTFKIEWNNSLHKTLHCNNDFQLEAAEVQPVGFLTQNSILKLSAEKVCVMTYYAAPNAP
ncbi:hypothetical protein NH26_18560 [Flammeovirga pacifica]|uniref:Uncharacterized protein n=2 Tax=Flammeovirga pacifica TaxID=915059 RepID=A0A1S1Z4Q5_FLAPC|nr:hypothetical protein NH26_18560 [Flammeovirga pacifica]